MPSHDQGTDSGVTNSESLEIVLVAAMDEQRVIGYEGRLPWHLPADLRHFKQVTMGHPIAMGRRTYESIGHPLPGRHNIVLTHNEDYPAPGCEVVSGIEEATEAAEKQDGTAMMIIGGESLYRQMLPRAERMELTIVYGSHRGDTYFPDFDGTQWELVEHRFYEQDQENESSMSFVRLRAAVDTPRHVKESANAGPLPKPLRSLNRNDQPSAGS